MDNDANYPMKRAKLACSTCKLRRKKCDGRQPCGICVRYERQCLYDPQYQIRPPSLQGTSVLSPRAKPHARNLTSTTNKPRVKSAEYGRHQIHGPMEANAGTVFPYLLGRSLDPSKPPERHAFGWNLGLGEESISTRADVTCLLSRWDMERLADVYFDKIHPVYGFVDKDTLKHKVSTRWDETSAPERYDAVLLGVAALGSLFSGESVRDQERELAQTAGNMLEPASTSARPVYYDAVAWLLRTIYLRVTSPPHAAWMASGITMQLIEATGAHQDPDSSSSISPDTCDKITGKEFQRRLFWVATVLNSWISNECGRSRVVLQAASCNEPHSHHGNLTSDMVKLYRISELLEPNNQDEVSGLTGGLSEVENLELTHDALILSQANLAFAMYRRLRASGSHLPNEALGRIIRMGNTGLDAAVRMAEDRCPWWHVANVPFQFVCVLVAMETNESLSHLGRALQALRTIAQRFGTKTIQAALQTAESLIRMSKKQKERQVSMLETALGQQDGLSEPTVQASREPTVLSASGELPPAQNDDVLNWGWDDFLNVDIPVFGDLGFIDHGNAGHFD